MMHNGALSGMLTSACYHFNNGNANKYRSADIANVHPHILALNTSIGQREMLTLDVKSINPIVAETVSLKIKTSASWWH